MIETKDELQKTKNDTNNLKDAISELKRKNLIINKHKKEIYNILSKAITYKNYS